MAFGEVLFDEHLVNPKQPYLFNGKELDFETGLYYYGARYYDPKVSLWLNTDPLSGYNPILETEHYIDGQHNGGIYSSMNMATYSYTYQNPVIYVDPNGKQAYFLHGTWSKPETFKDKKGLRNATYRAFGNKEANFTLSWSGYNASKARTIATKKVLKEIMGTMSSDINEPITLVGHSHGGNVNIEAINMMFFM
ncbi:MAG: RHS repeat-associated core domain-containing protein [Flavobacteriaceae bacterium]|nr:RHS repeat-associated core domain-containing protein [Flavobacteriaceae bacterium]